MLTLLILTLMNKTKRGQKVLAYLGIYKVLTYFGINIKFLQKREPVTQPIATIPQAIKAAA
jgi:hypothetical protein